jgi:V/A-type H+-transporting ATPase subunit I
MAIAKIKKIEVIGLKEDEEKFLKLLQKLGIVQLISTKGQSKEKVGATNESEVLEIAETLSYLASFQEKSNPLASMVNIKPIVYEKQLEDIVSKFNYRILLKELATLRNGLKNLTQYKERLTLEKNLLTPWRKLSLPLHQIRSTNGCATILGIFATREYEKIFEEYQKEKIAIFSEVISQDKTNTYIVFISLQKDYERLEAILKKYHFNFVVLPHHKCSVKERLLELHKEVVAVCDQIEEAKEKISTFLKHQFELKVIYDYLANTQQRHQVDANIARQQFTFNIQGWIKQKDVPLLDRTVVSQCRDIALFLSDPRPDDEVPVDLENIRIVKPFEFITKIYGFPKYHELDPTPYLAPFFLLYFGLCISDVGYGIILTAICWYILKKFRLGEQGLRFFRLFLLCGISTIVIGALTGSWFGNVVDLVAQNNKAFSPLKEFKDSLIILDPMKEPTKLLAIALSFGIIQVWFGNIVGAIGNFKNKRYLDILYDQISMLVLLFGLTGLGLIFLKLFDNAKMSLFKYAALIGALALILTQGRSEKGLGSKLFYGIYNLYNALSGYLSDILSYSRLWALGLVTGVMATTINLISVQFSEIFVSVIPFVGKVDIIKIIISTVILLLIFICGHLVSFLMNLLGAFVHPVRLQFVEFFSKFFKTNGIAFKPFKVETKYINFD